MKAVVIIDTLWLGHVPTYHKILIERFLTAGHRVISLTPRHTEIKNWAESSLTPDQRSKLFSEDVFSKNVEPGVQVAAWQEKLARLLRMNHYLRARAWWQHCAAAISWAQSETSWQVDFAFLPGVEANIISTALTGRQLDRLFPYKWGGLYVTPKYLRKGFFKFCHKRLLRKDRFFEAENCIAAAVLDEGVVARLGRIVGPEKVIIMPDITDGSAHSHDRTLVDKLTTEAKGRKVIGLFGEMSKRKGIRTLIATAHLAKKLNRPWFFVLAGSLTRENNPAAAFEELRTLFDSAPNNCIFSFSRIENEAVFNDLILNCDVVYAAYEKFYHSSNLLTKAALFRKPVLVSRGYCMQERVERFGIGVAVPETFTGAAFAGIEALLKAEDLSGNTLALDFEGYATQHTITQLDFFIARLMARLEKRPESPFESLRSTRLMTRLDR